MSDRIAKVERTTKESSITVEVNLDGSGRTDIATGIPFYDHMLTALGQHGSFDLTVHAQGDVEIEAHHTVEDTAIVLGDAFNEALGDKRGIRRFGDCFIPMDETLAHASVDVSGRPYCVFTGEPDYMVHSVIGGYRVCPTRPSSTGTYSNPSHSTRASRCTCACSTAAIRITSPRPSSRLSHAHCVRRSNRIRA